MYCSHLKSQNPNYSWCKSTIRITQVKYSLLKLETDIIEYSSEIDLSALSGSTALGYSIV